MIRAIAATLILLAALAPAPAETSTEAEKEAAKAPFANDLGPDKVDVSSYPATMQKTYKEFLPKCAKCHSLARPLNSQFLEVGEKEIAAIINAHPEAAADESLLKVETGIWKRYVKRMMSKPGCDIKSEEGKAIWQFLVFDSKERKLKDLPKWIGQRESLLKEFKTRQPERYEELYGKKGGKGS